MGILKKASQAAKNVTKKVQKATVKSITKPLSKVPGAKNVAQKLEAESMRGIDKYSDMGQDLAANVGTGGAYGAAMAAESALDNPQAFAKGLTSKEGLTNLGSQYAGSQLGVDPSLLKAGAGVLQGQSLDPKAMALQAASSYAGQQYGLDPMLTEQGLNVAQGKGIDAKNLATSFGAQQMGIDSNIARGIANQDMRGLVASQVPGLDSTKQQLLSRLSSQGQLKDQLASLSPKDSGTLFDPLISGAKKLFTGKSDDIRDAQGEYEAMQRKQLEDLRNAQGDYEQMQKEGQEPSTLDKVWRETKRIGGQAKDVAGTIGGKVKEGVQAAVDYNAENPELANAAIGTGASALAFKQRQDALQAQQKILSEQLEQARKMQTFQQEKPELYQEMVKGGPTSKYAQEMLGTAREAGQVAQAGRSAALERMSRMGRGGGELEAMLSGAQEGANRYAQAGQQSMMRDQDLRLAAQQQLSAIDRFNIGLQDQTQRERIAMEQGLRGQERGYQAAGGQLRAGLTEAGAGAAMEANAAIANRKMLDKQRELQHQRDMEKLKAQQPQIAQQTPQAQPQAQPQVKPQVAQQQPQAPVATPATNKMLPTKRKPLNTQTNKIV